MKVLRFLMLFSLIFYLMGIALVFAQNIPEGYAKNFPMYPNANITNSSESKDLQIFAMDLEASDDINKVDSWYKSELPTMGWEIGRRDVENSTITYLIANQEKEARASVSIGASENVTVIRITFGKRGSWQALQLQ